MTRAATAASFRTAFMDFFLPSCLLLRDGHVAMHSSVVVAGHEAGDLEDAVLRELPDDLSGLPRCQADRVRLVVFHLRELLHQSLVLHDLVFLVEHELMCQRRSKFMPKDGEKHSHLDT